LDGPELPAIRFERYCDDLVVHCVSVSGLYAWVKPGDAIAEIFGANVNRAYSMFVHPAEVPPRS
jgi:hypothetical protein